MSTETLLTPIPTRIDTLDHFYCCETPDELNGTLVETFCGTDSVADEGYAPSVDCVVCESFNRANYCPILKRACP